MWWSGSGWDHMHGGWWFMPFFGIICIVIFLFFISRLFSGRGCGGFGSDPTDQQDEVLKELKDEISQLRREIDELKK